ncbi:MAG: type IV pilin protein [Candidatus Avelusimicrobium sp.]|uniref:type IV pilin protein n=1 Tax=Candidatus Avelusimicrobium sp. TaxID=3048833 RepID=UPI003F06FC0D
MKGFTLIELLVVVLIIGILSSVALPQYQKAVLKSRTAEAWTNLKNLNMAANAYCLENPNGYVHSPAAYADELAVKVEDSKSFTYEVFVDCNARENTRILTHAQSRREYIALSLNPTTGRRSCVGPDCSKIGFSKSGSGSGICTFVCGGTHGSCGASDCYYAD